MRIVLDTRPAAAYLAGHLPKSVNIPLEDLARRVHELPPPGRGIEVFDKPPRLERALEFLRQRGDQVSIVQPDASELSAAGPSRHRLWQPNAFLVEALGVIRNLGEMRGRRAVDVACGTGRDAAFLAIEGLEVTAIDILPEAVERAEDLAGRYGARITGVVQDLEKDPRLPGAPFDLVIGFRYLQRSLFPVLRDAVAAGGYVVYETFHERNRQTGRPPRSDAHLLRSGELAEAFAGFEHLIWRDGVEKDGRFVSQLLARRR